MIHLLHRWGKWEQEAMETRFVPHDVRHLPEVVDAIRWTDCLLQKRICTVCGKQQSERVW